MKMISACFGFVLFLNFKLATPQLGISNGTLPNAQFEDGTFGSMWLESSTGSFKWSVQSFNSGQPNFAGRPPQLVDGGSRYLQLIPHSDGMFSCAVFKSHYFATPPFGNVILSFQYYISSEFRESNNLLIFYKEVNNTPKLIVSDLYKSSNQQWEKFTYSFLPNGKNISVEFHGIVGVHGKDCIAVDNIAVNVTDPASPQTTSRAISSTTTTWMTPTIDSTTIDSRTGTTEFVCSANGFYASGRCESSYYVCIDGEIFQEECQVNGTTFYQGSCVVPQVNPNCDNYRECSSVLDGTTNFTIKSPAFPQFYSNNYYQCWYIETYNMPFSLKVFHFHVEQDHDFLEVLLNNSTYKKWTGYVEPGFVGSFSKVSSVSFVFLTDNSPQDLPGFHFKYIPNEEQYCTLIDAPGDYISSLIDPSQFPEQTFNCWKVILNQAPANFTNFTFFEPDKLPGEATTPCTLSITSPEIVSEPYLYSFSGAAKQDYTLELYGYDVLFIRFDCFTSYTERGFNIQYDLTAEITTNPDLFCNFSMTSPSSEITSENYPNPYSHSISQCWTFDPPSRRITFTIDQFNTEKNYDVLKIYKGFVQMPIAVLSGSVGRQDITIDDAARVTVVFNTDDTINEGYGFKILYSMYDDMYLQLPNPLLPDEEDFI